MLFAGEEICGHTDVRTLTLALLTMLVMVSLIPLTGWSKQISLAQITFVGAGAFAFLQWAPDLGTIGGLVIAVIANGLPLITSQSGIQFVVTGLVLLVAASVDAISRKRTST